MDIEKKGESTRPRVATEPGAEAAAAKIWAIYIGEAEKYDKGLVESWRSDMDGMLIFAGLFSASLTAFLIESYKTLNPDSGDSTVRLLTQISQQLSASAEGSTFVVPHPPTFTPSNSALVCNALWFISLGLSLSCALIATLLEQWARDFIHRSEIRSAPLIRARIFSFLYYGLKRFNMHAVVEIIPLLLHTALLFFLAGLVAFLIPVNTPMAVVAAALLVILTVVYSILTILPLAYLDSPYRTPLSGVCWRAVERLRSAWQRRHSVVDGTPEIHPHREEDTILEAVFDQATKGCEERVARDRKALIWTVKSLSDELELEPFVQGIPSILWGPDHKEQRLSYADHFRQLVFHPDVALYARIKGLLDSCHTGMLSAKATNHRQTVCFKALWAITSLFIPPVAGPTPPLSELLCIAWPRSENTEDQNEVFNSYVSAVVLMQWVDFYNVKPCFEEILHRLQTTVAGSIAFDLTQTMEFLLECTDKWSGYEANLATLIRRHQADGLSNPSVFIPKLTEALQRTLNCRRYDIRLWYFHCASRSDSLPYFFDNTLDLTQPPNDTICHLPRGDYTSLLHMTVSRQLREFNSPDNEWMDEIVKNILCDWSRQNSTEPITALYLSGLLDYLNSRQCRDAVERLIFRGDNRGWLWESFVKSIQDASDDLDGCDPSTQVAFSESLRALWRCILFGFPYMYPSTTSFHAWLDKLTHFGTLSYTPSILVLTKFHYLGTWPSEITDPIFPTESAVLLDTEDSQSKRQTEAKILYLAEFVQSCAGSGPFPYKAVETLQSLHFEHLFGAIHRTYQTRLANAIRDLFSSLRCADLRPVLLDRRIFELYATDPSRLSELGLVGLSAWLDDIHARSIIKEVFTAYAEDLSSVPDPPADLTRVRAILEGFDRLHLASGTDEANGLNSATTAMTDDEPV